MHSQSITVCISDKHTPQHRHQGGKTIKYLEEAGSPGRRLMVCVNQALFLSRWVCLCPQAAGLSPRGAGRQARMPLRCAQREEAFYRLQGYVHSVEHDRWPLVTRPRHFISVQSWVAKQKLGKCTMKTTQLELIFFKGFGLFHRHTEGLVLVHNAQCGGARP